MVNAPVAQHWLQCVIGCDRETFWWQYWTSYWYARGCTRKPCLTSSLRTKDVKFCAKCVFGVDITFEFHIGSKFGMILYLTLWLYTAILNCLLFRQRNVCVVITASNHGMTSPPPQQQQHQLQAQQFVHLAPQPTSMTHLTIQGGSATPTKVKKRPSQATSPRMWPKTSMTSPDHRRWITTRTDVK